MRKGNNPALVFDKKGRLVALATGSDATNEHECGSKELMSALCEQYAGEDHLISQIRDGKTVKFPMFLDIKRITRFPEGLVFEETSGGAGSLPEAIMGYAPNKMALRIYEAELMFPVFQIQNVDKDVAGAWDSRSFAIRVRGEKYVKALKDFYTALRAGKVLFASTFFQRKGMRLSGVVLANSEYFRPEDFVAIREAEEEYYTRLRLKAHDESREIYRSVCDLLGENYIGHISPFRFDESGTQVLYWFNPDPRLNVGSRGPYSKEAILDWAKANGRYRLSC